MIRRNVDYDHRLENLIARRTGHGDIFAKGVQFGTESELVKNAGARGIYEVYEKLGKQGSAVQYTAGAMAKVDPRYTEITFEQGERVRNQLEKWLEDAKSSCDFEYQGSVTNNTHIKRYSDIDLLVITRRFWTLEPPQVPLFPYAGNPVEDLTEVRTTSLGCLKEAFPTANIDSSGAKSISISGGSLRRKIDVVPANWYHTNQYANDQAKRFRAIQILDIKSGERMKNMPFMHNYLIQKRDERTNGGLRKVIRLMKSLKYDSGSVGLSSYDLSAIGYNMPETQLYTLPGCEIELLVLLKLFLDKVASSDDLRAELVVPDGSRRVFAPGHATIEGLRELQDEVDDLVAAVQKNLEKPFTKLAEARLDY